MSLSDDFVRAVVLSRQCVTNANVYEIITTVEPGIIRPELPEALKLWLESMEEFSLKFKADRNFQEKLQKESVDIAFWSEVTTLNCKN